MISPTTIAEAECYFFALPLTPNKLRRSRWPAWLPAAPTFGQTVTLTAQVTPSTAAGSVSFMDQGVLIGTGTVSLSGVAQAATLTFAAVAAHTQRDLWRQLKCGLSS